MVFLAYFDLKWKFLYTVAPSKVAPSGSPKKKLLKKIRRFEIQDSEFDLMRTLYFAYNTYWWICDQSSVNLPDIVINAEVVCFSHRNSDRIRISIKILEEFCCRLSADGTMVLIFSMFPIRIHQKSYSQEFWPKFCRNSRNLHISDRSLSFLLFQFVEFFNFCHG